MSRPAWLPCCLVALLSGCLLLGACAAADRPTGVVGLASSIDTLRSEIGDVRGTIEQVDQSTNNWDVWALRAQQIMPWLVVGGLGALPASYISGKLLWKLAGRFGGSKGSKGNNGTK